jgi:hypothetical protein
VAVESLTLTARAAALVRNNGGPAAALASYAPASWVSLAFQLSHLPPASARVLAIGHSHRRRYLFSELGQGVYDNKQGLVVLTTERMFFFEKSMGSQTVEEFRSQ